MIENGSTPTLEDCTSGMLKNMGWMRLGVIVVLLLATGLAQNGGLQSAAAEQELFRLTNRDRAEAGLPELQWNEWLAQAARKHAAEMARRGRLSHQFPGEAGLRDRIAATSLHFDASGENVAVGPNTTEINQGWMLSSGHRANILDARYNSIGVAVVRVGEDLFAVTDFAHSVAALSAGDLEGTVAAAINQARAQKRLAPLAWRQDPALHQYACQMAKEDQVNAKAALERSNVYATLAFNDVDPANFGSHFRNLPYITTSKAFALGACFERTAKYPEGTNWIVVAFY